MIIRRQSKQTLVLEHVIPRSMASEDAHGCIGVLAETFHDAQV